MNKKITVINDIHEGATNAISCTYAPENPDEYLAGDNFDFANCSYEAFKSLLLKYHTAKNLYGSRMIDGNHERASDYNQHILVGGKAIIVHGDFESWGDEKAIEYRRRLHCASKFKRWIVVNAIEAFERMVGRRPSEEMLKRLVAKARMHYCTTIICGHLHPRQTFDQVVDGVRVIVLKRGRNEVML